MKNLLRKVALPPKNIIKFPPHDDLSSPNPNFPDDDEEKLTLRRTKTFSQMETDILLNLFGDSYIFNPKGKLINKEIKTKLQKEYARPLGKYKISQLNTRLRYLKSKNM